MTTRQPDRSDEPRAPVAETSDILARAVTDYARRAAGEPIDHDGIGAAVAMWALARVPRATEVP